jgi:hypothetical protein
VVPQENQTIAHLAQKSFNLSFRRLEIVLEFACSRHYVPALPDREVAKERNHVGADIDQQHSAQPDVLIDKANDRAGDHPAALHPSQ